MDDGSGIYMIVNRVTGHRYVGQTINFRKRFTQHRTKTHQRRSVIGRAFHKHGKDAFEFIVLERCPADMLDAREIRHIARLRPEYNMNKGGDGNRGFMVRPEVRACLSAKSRAWWRRLSDEEKRAIVSRIQKNRRPVSAETRARMSAANKRFWAGKKRPGYRLGMRKVIAAKEST